MKNKYVIGIDVGAKGALCVLKNDNIHKLIPFKSIKNYAKEMQIAKDEYAKEFLSVVVEKIHSMPRQGVKSMFSFGQRFGEVIGMLDTLNICYNLVTPQEWQKKLAKDKKIVYNKQDTKASIGELIYKKFGRQINLLKRTGRINTDLTDAIAIAYTYADDCDKLANLFVATNKKKGGK